MSDKRRGFSAGISFVVVSIDFVTIITQYHKWSPASRISGWNTILFVVLMLIFGLCCIDLNNYWHDR